MIQFVVRVSTMGEVSEDPELADLGNYLDVEIKGGDSEAINALWLGTANKGMHVRINHSVLTIGAVGKGTYDIPFADDGRRFHTVGLNLGDQTMVFYVETGVLKLVEGGGLVYQLASNTAAEA